MNNPSLSTIAAAADVPKGLTPVVIVVAVVAVTVKTSLVLAFLTVSPIVKIAPELEPAPVRVMT